MLGNATTMFGIEAQRIFLTTLLGICGMCILQAAHAQPPVARSEGSLQRITSALSHVVKSDSRPQALRLDLRPPLENLGEPSPAATGLGVGGNHRLFGGGAPGFQADRGTAERAAPAVSGHIMSPMETVVHNFHQEGLPVAKLFQSETSLVHIGLNPRGKPGLWVVHKTR
jgi:hypothetical protein